MIDKGVKLERMANEIASFFRSYPHAEAVAGIRDHITSFWAPVMRRDLATRAAGQGHAIDPLVIEAIETSSGASSPAERESAGPAQLGEIGASDAG